MGFVFVGGFEKQWLEVFVAGAAKLKVSSSASQLQKIMETSKKAFDEAAETFDKIPDVSMMEAFFLAFMTKNGSALADHKSLLEKNVKQFRSYILKTSISEQDADPDGLHTNLEVRAADILEVIAIYTMVTLLRNPSIQNLQEKEMRKNLKTVRDSLQVNEETIPVLFKEVRQVLGESERAGAVAPAGGTTSATGEGGIGGVSHGGGRGRGGGGVSRGGGRGCRSAAIQEPMPEIAAPAAQKSTAARGRGAKTTEAAPAAPTAPPSPPPKRRRGAMAASAAAEEEPENPKRRRAAGTKKKTNV